MIAQNIQNKTLRDGRQESFCQWVARSIVSNTQAYRNAGYSDKSADANAARLIGKESIKTRIAQIRAIKERKVIVTPESVAIEAEDQRQLALAIGDMKAANAALVIKAKAYGCQTDKNVTETTEAQRELTAKEQEQARRIAEIMVKEDMDCMQNSINVSSSEDNEAIEGHSPSLSGDKQG